MCVYMSIAYYKYMYVYVMLTCYDLSLLGEMIRREDRHILLDTKFIVINL